MIWDQETRVRLALDYKCPRCGRPENSPCRSMRPTLHRRILLNPHKERVVRRREEIEAAKFRADEEAALSCLGLKPFPRHWQNR